MGKIKKENVIEVLKQCYDPEIPVDLWSLGLIYEIEIQDSYEGDTSDINIVMSLTTPGCGMGQMMADDIRTKLEAREDVNQAFVQVTFDPPWEPEMMSKEARDKLGFAPSPSTGQTGNPVTINTEWE
mgnify:FL=1